MGSGRSEEPEEWVGWVRKLVVQAAAVAEAGGRKKRPEEMGGIGGGVSGLEWRRGGRRRKWLR